MLDTCIIPDVYSHTLTEKEALNIIDYTFYLDKDSKKNGRIADILLFLSFNLLVERRTGKQVFEYYKPEWRTPENDKSTLIDNVYTQIVRGEASSAMREADTTNFAQMWGLNPEGGKGLVTTKLIGAYAMNYIRLVAKADANVINHFSRVKGTNASSAFVRSFISLYPEEIGNYDAPKTVPTYSKATLLKIRVHFSREAARATSLVLRMTKILNDNRQSDKHQIINAFGGMEVMEYGLPVYSWILKLSEIYELTPISLMARLAGPYMDTMLTRVRKYYYIYKATDEERQCIEDVYGAEKIPSKYWQSCRLANCRFLADLGRSANKTALKLLAFTYAYSQGEKNMITNQEYIVPECLLSNADAAKEAGYIHYNLQATSRASTQSARDRRQ